MPAAQSLQVLKKGMVIIMYRCLVFGSGSAYLYRKFNINYKFVQIIAILDNDQLKWGTRLDGILIDKPNNIYNYEFDYILIASSYYIEIQQQLITLGIGKEKIIPFYAFVNPGHLGRLSVSNHYIKYDSGYRYGIEVGGANNPIEILDQRVVVKQVDYCDHSLIEDCFSGMTLVKVDIIDDGERLDTIADNSLDFIVACHMLEHCRNPIGTIRNFIQKLRQDGLIILAIPDKRFTFDINREVTQVDHLLLDDIDPSRERDKVHYFDKEVNLLSEEELKFIQKSMEMDERIHFHVWDPNYFIQFICETKKYLKDSFSIEQVGSINNGEGSNEILCILKKL